MLHRKNRDTDDGIANGLTRSEPYLANLGKADIEHTNSPPRDERIHPLPEIVAWAATAISSGIVGNLAYDVVKSFAIRLRRHSLPKAVTSEWSASMIAIYAVQARCAELGWAIPKYRFLVIDNASCSEDGHWRVVLSHRSSEMTAEVHLPTVQVQIPPGDLADAQVTVTLRGVVTGYRNDSGSDDENRSGRPLE